MKKRNFFESVKDKLKDYLRFAISLLALGVIFSLIGNMLAIRNAQSKIIEAEGSVEKLRDENQALKTNLQEVESDFYTEKQLRDSLGLSKEGEYVVVLPSDDVLRKLAPKEYEEAQKLPDPIWKRWVNLFL